MPDTDSIPPPPVRTSPGLVRHQALQAAARVHQNYIAPRPEYPYHSTEIDAVIATARRFEAYLLGDDR